MVGLYDDKAAVFYDAGVSNAEVILFGVIGIGKYCEDASWLEEIPFLMSGSHAEH